MLRGPLMMLMGLRVAHLNVNLLVWGSLSRGVISLKPLFFHKLVFVIKLCAHVYLVYKAEHQVSSLVGYMAIGSHPNWDP